MFTYWDGRLHIDEVAVPGLDELPIRDLPGLTRIEQYAARAMPFMDTGLYILCGDDTATTNLVSGQTGSAGDASGLFSFQNLALKTLVSVFG